MNISANKGKHSELLAFLRILHEGRVQFSDGNGVKRESWFKVISVVRPTDIDRKYLIRSDSIDLIDKSLGKIAEIKREEVGVLADLLHEEIRLAVGASFVCPSTTRVAELLKFRFLKVTALAKANLFLEVASPIYEGQSVVLGFSVKSELGGLSSLLNAGATHFEYRIRECDAEAAMRVQESAPRVAGREHPGPLKLMGALYEASARVEFVRVENPIFEENLKMIDTSFPRILGETLKHAYLAGEFRLQYAVRNPYLLDELSIDLGLPRLMIERLVRHNFKELLMQSALGMSPGSLWDGPAESYGGWLIVKEDGTVICLDVANNNDFQDYLLNNSKFDTPSMKRQKAGYLFSQGDSNQAGLRLSLQIRFIEHSIKQSSGNAKRPKSH